MTSMVRVVVICYGLRILGDAVRAELEPDILL